MFYTRILKGRNIYLILYFDFAQNLKKAENFENQGLIILYLVYFQINVTRIYFEINCNRFRQKADTNQLNKKKGVLCAVFFIIRLTKNLDIQKFCVYFNKLVIYYLRI